MTDEITRDAPATEGCAAAAGYVGELPPIRGAIAPLKTRGKNKGHPNWCKLDKTTLREFITSIPKHEAWKVEWERKNHSCWRCHGQKQIVASISITTGTTYRPCPRCLGSGVFSPSQASTPEPAGVPQKLEKTHTGENG